jgi:hypothetical protein
MSSNAKILYNDEGLDFEGSTSNGLEGEGKRARPLAIANVRFVL